MRNRSDEAMHETMMVAEGEVCELSACVCYSSIVDMCAKIRKGDECVEVPGH